MSSFWEKGLGSSSEKCELDSSWCGYEVSSSESISISSKLEGGRGTGISVIWGIGRIAELRVG